MMTEQTEDPMDEPGTDATADNGAHGAADGAGHPRTDPAPSPAAAAPNWMTVVVVDVGVGVVALVVGCALAFAWQPAIGAGLASVGLLYAALAWRRGRRWAAWRRRNGLP